MPQVNAKPGRAGRWLLTVGVAVIAFVLCGLPRAASQNAAPVIAPEVTMRFSSDRIVLGEPVWVLVTARNASNVVLKWNPGDYCFMDMEKPVTAVAPEAALGSGKQEHCVYGAASGDCFIGGSTTDIAPGESATWRYLLEGDFHFTHAGTYHVELTSHPGKAFPDPGDKTATLAMPVPVTQTLTLAVTPKDDAALLAREKQMAGEMEAEILSEKRSPEGTKEREAAWREMQNVRRVRSGLAAQPTPGMETVFEHWLQLPNDFEGDAIDGLKNLNTKDSRAALAEIAKTSNKPNSHTQESATRALTDMGDQQYYPLVVELLASPNENVRRAAILGMGSLGGEAAVTNLLQVVRTGDKVEQGDALTALGDTKSRAAVKALIDLMAPTDAQKPLVDAWWPLFKLTHHRLEQVKYLRTPVQTHAAWQQWWDAVGESAPLYSSFECAPKDAP